MKPVAGSQEKRDDYMKYALLGATGTVGRALAAKLAMQGVPFRVVGRSEERLRRDFQIHEPLVAYCPADLSDPAAAARATEGIDTIFYTVGVPYPQFALHPKLTRIAIDAAAAAGVRQYIHLSNVYPYGAPQQEFVNESHPRNPTAFKGRMRKEQEDLVLAADNPHGMRTTILRPPDFYGPDSELSYVRAIFYAALRGGTATVIGPIDMPHEFIFVPDLADALLALSEKEEAYGQAWNVAGPGLITTRQFAELVFGAVHQKPRLRVVGKFMLRVLGLFNPILREVVEMHYLWSTPVKLDDTRLHLLLPDLHKTPYTPKESGSRWRRCGPAVLGRELERASAALRSQGIVPWRKITIGSDLVLVTGASHQVRVLLHLAPAMLRPGDHAARAD